MLKIEEIKRQLLNNTFDVKKYKNNFDKLNHRKKQIVLEHLELNKIDLLINSLYHKKTNLFIKELRAARIQERSRDLIRVHSLQNLLNHNSVMVLKGISLEVLMQNSTYKRKSDIDLFVKNSEFEFIFKKLKNIGFTKLLKERYGELSLQKGKTQVLDLHKNLTSASPFFNIINFEDLINHNTLVYSWNGYEFKSFTIEKKIMYLAIHSCINHKLREFIQIYEIVQILHQNADNFDTKKFIQIVKNHNSIEIIDLVFSVLLQLSSLNIINLIYDEIIYERKHNSYSKKIIYRLSRSVITNKRTVFFPLEFLLLSRNLNYIFPYFEGYIKVNLFKVNKIFSAN